MESELLDCVEVNPLQKPVATIIWLHGLGADGHDFEPIVPELGLPDSLPIRYIFPHAPMRPVTINAGMVMRAWFDILDIELSRKVDIENFLESAEQLKSLIQAELQNGMSADKVVLAGFSHGGAIALHTGLRFEQPLAGILALSTYLPTADTLDQERSQANANVPIMMAHGTMDPLVPIANAKTARQTLTRLKYEVSWHEYPMQHAVCPEEIRDIGDWFRAVLAR
jgi:phospholipase/carboxylesterase